MPSRFELFFDLVFVAIAHQLSDGAAEQASAVGVAQFVLVCDLSFHALIFDSDLCIDILVSPSYATLRVENAYPLYPQSNMVTVERVSIH